MVVNNGLNVTQYRSRIIEMHDAQFKNCEIMKALDLSVGKVAGVIWRYKNPGLQQKGVKNMSFRKRNI